MDTEVKELINLIVQMRLSYYYSRRKRYTPDKIAARDKLEDEFEALLKELPEEQSSLIRRHEDQILSECGDENVLYYRGGLNDGIHLKALIRRLSGPDRRICKSSRQRRKL